MTWARAAQRAEQEEPSEPRRPGQKTRGEVNWPIGERMFVHGVGLGTDGKPTFPSYADIAERIGVTKAAVHQYARRHDWQGKRDAVYPPPGSVQALLDSGKRPKLKPGALLDVYLAQFEESVLLGRVPFNSLPDFERAVKLKAALEEVEAKKAERAGIVSLDQLRDRHRAHVAQEGGLSDASAGVLAQGQGNVDDPREGPANDAQEPEPESPSADDAKADAVAATVGKRPSGPTATPKARGKRGA